MWECVKKALNSTVGTSNFKPLNELYDNSFYVYPSAETLYNVGYISGDSKVKTNTFTKKINVGGSLIVKIRLTTSNYFGLGERNVVVYVNNVSKGSASMANRDDYQNPNTERNFEINLEVKKGDVIKIVNTNTVGETSAYTQYCGVASYIYLMGSVASSPSGGVLLDV